MSNINDFVIQDGVLLAYRGQDAQVEVPAGVTRIGSEKGFTAVFAKNSGVTSVVLPEGLTAISRNVFYFCTTLESVRLPESLTEIGEYAFGGCSKLEDVQLPAGLTSIGRCAFSGCGSFTRIEIPEKVEKIGDFAFSDCSNVKSLTIASDSVVIDEAAFSGCAGLAREDGFLIVGDVLYGYFGSEENVVIPDTVRVVSGVSFINNANITSVTIPEGVTHIGFNAFNSCKNLAEVRFPQTLKKIGDNAFQNCKALAQLNLPDAITEISNGAFNGCSALTAVVIPKATKNVRWNVFGDCTALEQVTLHDGMENLGGNAFHGCHKLSEITLPDSLKHISSGAFTSCSTMTHIFIPAGVETDRWNESFAPETLVILRDRITKISKIEKHPCCNSGNILYTVSNGDRTVCKLLLTSPYMKLFNKKGDFDWQQYDLLLANNGPKIKMSAAFRTLAMVYRLRYPENLTDAIKTTFIEHVCKNIKRIAPYANIQPEDGLVALLEEIGAITAKNKKTILPLMGIGEAPKPKAEKAAAPDGVKTPAQIRKEWTTKKLDDGTLRLNSYKGGDIDVLVPDMIGKDKVSTIGEDCFAVSSWIRSTPEQQEHRKKIRSVTIPEGITAIETSAFSSCESLEKVVLPQSLAKIGPTAFSRCVNLKDIRIPENTQVGLRIFVNCKALADENGCVIQGGILYNYSGTEEKVTLPKGITKIGPGAFSGSNTLKILILPEETTEIMDHAFSRCNQLVGVAIPGQVTKIDPTAFNQYRMTIVGLTGSYAEKFAQSRNYNFNSVGVMENAEDTSDFVIEDGVLVEYTGKDKEVTIPAGVTAIGYRPGRYSWDRKGAFESNTGLESVIIPAGVTEIRDRAFCGCTNLNSLTFPDTIVHVGSNAFRSVPGMVEEADGTVYVGRVVVYCTGKEKEVAVREGTKAVARDAFSGAAVTKVVLPEGLERIGENAFSCCRKLEEMVVPASVTELGEYAFDSVTLRKVSGGVLHKTTKMPAAFKVFYTGDVTDTAWIALYQSEKSWQKPIRDMTGSHVESLDPVLKHMAELINAMDALDKAVGNRAAAFAQDMCKFAGKDGLQAVYDALKSKKHPSVKKLDADEAFTLCMQGQAAEDLSKLHPVEALVVQNLQYAPAFDNVLKMLPEGIRYRDSQEVCAPRVVAFVISEYVKQYDPESARYVSEYEYACTVYKRSAVADEVAAALDQEQLLELMQRLADMNGGAYWLPYARFADEKRAAALVTQMGKWGQWGYYGADGRKNIMVARCGLLLNDSRAAMLHFDKIKRLQLYAEQRGTDADTLRDTVLSEFGFDKNREIRFDLGGNTLVVRMADDLSLCLFDINAGKTVKSVPKKNADPALYEKAKAAVSDLKKNIKKVITNRRDTLFAEFLNGGGKAAANWKRSYLDNPVLNSIARLLVWVQDGKTFTLTANGAVDYQGNAVELGAAPIQVAHPMEMADVQADWQNYFASRGLKQPFEQVWEPAYRPENIKEDRYKDCKIPVYRMTNKEKHGITVWGLTDYSESYGFELQDCKLEQTPSEWRFVHGLTDDAVFELGAFSFEKMTRRVNHIVYLLDKWTVTERLLKDDVTVEALLDAFTAAQIREFVALTTENGCTNCTAMLLNYQNRNFEAFDPMAEFTLDL